MRPIAPRTGAPEISLGFDQVEYREVTVAVHRIEENAEGYAHVYRFRLSDEEKREIAEGEDVYLCLLYPNGGHATPMQIRVGAGEWRVE